MNTYYQLKRQQNTLQKLASVLGCLLFLSFLNVSAQDWQYLGAETGISNGGASYLNMARDASGNVYLSYYDVSVTKGSVQKFDGTSWTYVGGTPGITNGFATYNSICTGANGSVYYTNQGSGFEVRQFNGTGWSSLPVVTSATVNFQSSAVTPSGVLVAASNEATGTVKRYANGAWEQVGTTGFAGAVPYYLDMVIGSDNVIYLSYVNNGNIYVVKNNVNASSAQAWEHVGGSAGVAPATSSEQFRASMAINSANTVYVAYTSLSAGGNKLNVKKFNGTNWEQVGAENFSPARVHYVSIAISPSGIPYVAYSTFENSPDNKNAVAKFNGTNWENVGTNPVATGEAKYNALSFDASGNPVLAYTDSGTGKIMARRFVDNPTLPPGLVVKTTGGEATGTITENSGTLDLNAYQNEQYVADDDITWSIVPGGTGFANVGMYGWVTSVSDGTVTVRATLISDPSVYGDFQLTISGQVSGYCEVYFVNGCETASITNFYTTGGSANISNSSTGCLNSNGLNGYSDYTSNILGAARNSTVTFNFDFTHSAGYAPYLSAWIDWNHDFIFQESEKVFFSTNGESDNQVQFTATVPANAAIGQTRMRFKAVGGWEGSGACGHNSFGEIEDYTINILDPNTIQGVSITTQNGVPAAITADNGNLQLLATVSPAGASQNVTWTIIQTGIVATLTQNGLLSAAANGTVTVRATSVANPLLYGELTVEISNQVVDVFGVTIITQDNAPATITTNESTLQLIGIVAPTNATNTNVTWLVTVGEGLATVSASGLVTAIANGTVTIRATSVSNPAIYDEQEVVITNQYVAVTALEVSVANDTPATITTDAGTLQLEAVITPADATNTNVAWSVVSGSEFATVDANGLVTSTANGTVIVKAVSEDDTTLSDEIEITISNQYVGVTALEVSVANDAPATITVDAGTLQLEAVITPADATNTNVTWSVISGNEFATVDVNGLVTATANGTVIIKAVSEDDTTLSDEIEIIISNQYVAVTSLIVSVEGGIEPIITTANGTLQLTATILPEDATNAEVVWTIVSGAEFGSVSEDGVVTATANRTIVIRATSADNEELSDDIAITVNIPTAGLEDFAKNGLAVYPNPSTGVVTIASRNEIQQIDIYNTIGQLVLTVNTATFDLSGKEQGVYHVLVTLENGAVTVHKLVKQ